jgi:hypothetical protein
MPLLNEEEHQADQELMAGNQEYAAFERYAQLIFRKEELKSELKQIEATMGTLGPALLSYLGQGGFESVTVAGYKFFPRREPWVYPKEGMEREDVIGALKASGMEQFVTEQYSTQSLTKYVRDLEEQNEESLRTGLVASVEALIPTPLAAVIRINPTYRIHTLRTNK